MSRAARSVKLFGFYLNVLGAVLIVAPNLVLTAFRFAPTAEVHIRIVGVLTLLIGVYYVAAGRAELTAFFRVTIPVRCAVLLFFSAFAALRLAEPQLVLFGLVDVAGAAWTLLALRADATDRAPAAAS